MRRRVHPLATVPCYRCGAAMLWATTKAGKLMPIDAAPFRRDDLVPTGRWRLELVGGVLYVHHDVAAIDAPDVYTSHFATCPGYLTPGQITLLEPALQARIAAHAAAQQQARA